jgi:hypothetical protein
LRKTNHCSDWAERISVPSDVPLLLRSECKLPEVLYWSESESQGLRACCHRVEGQRPVAVWAHQLHFPGMLILTIFIWLTRVLARAHWTSVRLVPGLCLRSPSLTYRPGWPLQACSVPQTPYSLRHPFLILPGHRGTS